MSENTIREPWHLDRRIPVVLLFAFSLQTFGIVWWAATITSNQNAVIKVVERNTIGIKRTWDQLEIDGTKVTNTSERVAKMEGILEHVSRQLDRVLDKLDK